MQLLALADTVESLDDLLLGGRKVLLGIPDDRGLDVEVLHGSPANRL